MPNDIKKLRRLIRYAHVLQTLFIDARIDHASDGALCGEVQKRIFNNQNND